MDQGVAKISEGEVRRALKRMKSGQTVGPDDIPVEAWKCLGKVAVFKKVFYVYLFHIPQWTEKNKEKNNRDWIIYSSSKTPDFAFHTWYSPIK